MTHILQSRPDAPDRLAAVRRTMLLDTPPEEGFDRLTRMAARLLGAPVALVSLVAEDYEFFKSSTGLPEPWASRRCTPLAYSFCRHVISSGEAVVVEDARRHPLVRSSPAVRELGWIAFAGVPLANSEGLVLGALCVIDGMPRLWSERDLGLLQDLAASVVSEIELHALRAQSRPEPTPGNGGPPELNLEASGIPLVITAADGRWLEVSAATCDLLGFSAAELTGNRSESPVHPEDRAADLEAVKLLSLGECGSYTAERRLVGKAGQTVWVLASVSRLPLLDGYGPRFLAAFHDITARKRTEAALRESEQRFRLAARATQDAVWDWDLLTDNLVWVSGSATFGYTDAASGSTASWWYERLHPEDRERVLDSVKAATAAKAVRWEGEYRFRRADESFALVSDRCSIVYDEGGAPIRMSGGMTDVTHQRRGNQRAVDQSRLLEQIAKGIEVGRILERIVQFTEEHGEGMRASVMLLDRTGNNLRLASAPSLPEGFREAVAVIPVGEAVCGRAAGRRALVVVSDVATDPMVEPWREVALGAGLRACWSVPILSSSGSVLGTFAIYYAEPREPAAADLRTVEIATHLAGIAIEQSRNLEALQRTTRLLQGVLDALPIGVWVLGQDGKIVSCNPAGHDIWGVRYDEPDHFSEYRAWRPETGRQLSAEDWPAHRALQRGETSLNELLNIEGVDGSKKVILNSAVPLLEPSGEVRGAIVLNQDVTERQAATDALRTSEEELQHARKMEAVGQLAGGIAHDFNNLLTGILSYCDLILEEVRQGDPIRGDVEQIRHAGHRAAGLTRQLLAFSRRQVLQPRVLSLNATVVELDAMLRRLLGADVGFQTELDPGLWYVLADPNQLEQVLVNLVVNARDAMPGGGRVTIATSNRKLESGSTGRGNGLRGGEYVILSVSDTGVGMDPSTQARIFEPFFTTKEQGKGTGLGLSSVYGIVEQSGGYVAVESAPGRGAVFTIHLPRYQGGGAATAGRADRRSLPGGSEILLLVEDEAAVRASARRLLERHGYTVLEARHGADALRIVEENGRRVDLVLTDLVMPEMGGRELVERLRARQPGLKVLYMSGYTEKAIAVDGTMPPHTGFVEKPFTVEQLMRRLRRILDQ